MYQRKTSRRRKPESEEGGREREGERKVVKLTDIKARYLTSGFSCVMSSITLVFAPKAFTSLSERRCKKKAGGEVSFGGSRKEGLLEGSERGKGREGTSKTHFLPLSQCFTYCPTSAQATARTRASEELRRRLTRVLYGRGRVSF